ncbi:MAG: hypothetical protein QME96_17830, partial [Myxococcota bacterium]|nr:hypothetical protein [Myxococcota bacterium]
MGHRLRRESLGPQPREDVVQHAQHRLDVALVARRVDRQEPLADRRPVVGADVVRQAPRLAHLGHQQPRVAGERLGYDRCGVPALVVAAGSAEAHEDVRAPEVAANDHLPG